MVKPVNLSNEAYEVLSKMKTGDESFSDVVLRLAEKSEKKFDVDKFYGAWKEFEEWDGLKKTIKKNRKKFKLRTVNFDEILRRH